MRIGADCGQAEILAGAIALGEAGDAERNAYREHLSVCRRCLVSIGGEREIERVMSVIGQAREQEQWQPQARSLFARAKSRGPILRWSAAVVAALLVVFVARQGYQNHPVVVNSVTLAGENERDRGTRGARHRRTRHPIRSKARASRRIVGL